MDKSRLGAWLLEYRQALIVFNKSCNRIGEYSTSDICRWLVVGKSDNVLEETLGVDDFEL